MEKIKKNAIIFCDKAAVPEYMKQVVGWLEDKFNLAYLNKTDDLEQELYLSLSVRYVFVLVDLKEGDKRVIKEIIQKTEPQIDSFLEGPDTQLPSSFRLILEVATAAPETSPKAFHPCVISFSEDYMGSLGDRLGAFGVGLHINQSDSIFHDKQALLKAITFNASSQKYAERLYKSMPE